MYAGATSIAHLAAALGTSFATAPPAVVAPCPATVTPSLQDKGASAAAAAAATPIPVCASTPLCVSPIGTPISDADFRARVTAARSADMMRVGRKARKSCAGTPLPEAESLDAFLVSVGGTPRAPVAPTQPPQQQQQQQISQQQTPPPGPQQDDDEADAPQGGGGGDVVLQLDTGAVGGHAQGTQPAGPDEAGGQSHGDTLTFAQVAAQSGLDVSAVSSSCVTPRPDVARRPARGCGHDGSGDEHGPRLKRGKVKAEPKRGRGKTGIDLPGATKERVTRATEHRAEIRNARVDAARGGTACTLFDDEPDSVTAAVAAAMPVDLDPHAVRTAFAAAANRVVMEGSTDVLLVQRVVRECGFKGRFGTLDLASFVWLTLRAHADGDAGRCERLAQARAIFISLAGFPDPTIFDSLFASFDSNDSLQSTAATTAQEEGPLAGGHGGE